MKHWVRATYKSDELRDDAGGADLYLNEVREWFSRDGQTWEEQEPRWEMYSGSYINAISTHASEDAAIAAYADDYPGLEIELYEPEPEIERWSVDRGLQVPFAAHTMPDV